MLKFKVTPIDKSGNKAPYYIVDITNDIKNPEEHAINQAKSLSRLSDFDYKFECSQIFKKQ